VAFTAADSAEAVSTGVAGHGNELELCLWHTPKERVQNMSCSSTKNIVRAKKLAACLPAIAIIAMALTAWAQQPDSSALYSPTEQPKAKAFSKPGDAATALFAAAKRNDEAELLIILGPDAKEIVQWSDDPAERREHREMFAQKYEQMHRLVKEPDGTVALYVGSENWPLPVPLVKYHGAWYFDAELGQQEIRYRRIGGNEMGALEVCRTLVDAEKEYRTAVHQYTAKFMSSDESHDGLYWKSADDSAKSPIGPYLARAGVSGPDTIYSQPFHGYYYRILLQGPNAFAIVAFPAEYRSSGVVTFFVNQDGSAYEKDLGEQAAKLSNQISSSGVDNSWKQVE
jgi:hypothetical protein